MLFALASHSIARVSSLVCARTQPRSVSSALMRKSAAASKLSPPAARRDLVVSEAELEAGIRARRPRIVVYRNWLTAEPFARWDGALRAGGYRRVATVESAGIYLRAG